MLGWFLRRQIAKFERTWNYDASYLHEMIDTDPKAMLAFGKLQAIGRYRKDVPAAEVHVLDAGHFALDTKADEIAAFVRAFIKK